MSDSYDVIVIGAGMAGLFSAEEAAKQGLSVCLIEESMFGGLVVRLREGRCTDGDFACEGLCGRCGAGGLWRADQRRTNRRESGGVRNCEAPECSDAKSIIAVSGRESLPVERPDFKPG